MNVNDITTAARLRNARFMDDVANKILDREYYKFRYLPLEGKLPGLYFQQQTEDAINDIGNVAYATEKVADEALQIAQQAYNTALVALEIGNNALAAAQAAQQTATTALNAANAAQNAADAAQATANNAVNLANAAVAAAATAQDTANNAIEIANNANTKAEQAITAAQTAQTTANNANARLDIVQPIVEKLQWYNNVDDVVDLNTYIELGRKYIGNASSPNLPTPVIGWLDIDEDENETIIRQMFIAESTGKKYVRFGAIVPDSDPTEISSWSAWVEYAIKTDLDSTTNDLTALINTVSTNLAAHKADYDNPHKVTAEQLGLATAYVYKGSVATYADLPTTGQKNGDTYNVETADPDHGIKAGDNVAWDGSKWDVLGGNHDLSAYATLAGNNTWTSSNKFTSNISVSNGATAGSAGSISIGVSPTDEPVQARISTDNLGGLFYQASTNQPHIFRVGSNIDVLAIKDDDQKMTLSSSQIAFATVTHEGVARWLGNAKTATKLENPRTINGVAFDGTKDITIEAGGGGGDVTAAGNNNFTGTNTFTNITYLKNYVNIQNPTNDYASLYLTQNRTGGGVQGIGKIVYDGTTFKISNESTNTIQLMAQNNLLLGLEGTEQGCTISIADSSQLLRYDKTRGLFFGGGGTNKLIAFYPEAADNTAGMRLSNTAEAISTDYSVLSLQNNAALTYTQNAALQVGGVNMFEVDNSNKNITIRTFAGSGASILFVPDSDTNNTSRFDSNGNFYISQGLTVGSTLNTGTSNGVIRAGNNESCLYFTGTAENTYYATPNTGNTISYQSAANCYLINCSINNPSSLNMNFSNMNFKATVGSVPYMCKTLTFWLPVGATVPAVTWTFPSGSAVYYPKGVAPTLTANANNIINVIAIVDDTDSFSIQVCETVVLPYSG